MDVDIMQNMQKKIKQKIEQLKHDGERISTYVVTVFIVIISYVGWTHRNDNIMALLTALLVAITALYGFFTFKILKESKKDREIQLIIRKLEEFYIPLINNKVFWRQDDDNDLYTFAHSNDSFRIHDSSAMGRIKNITDRYIQDFWIICRDKEFLASNEIRKEYIKELKRYFKNGKKENYALKHSNDFQKFRRDFKKLLEKEYDILVERMNQLGGS